MKALSRRLVKAGGIVGAGVLVLNVASAFIATRPALQARVFGRGDRQPRTPADLDLTFDRVSYGKDLWGWLIPAERSKGAVVLVHGFGLTDAPIRDGPAPLLPLADDLRERGFTSLLINLGYATGAHPYTGGRDEAADISRAVDWLTARGCGPIVVWGFSAGGHDALIAAATNDDIVGVVADSAFVDTAEIVQQQAALAVHLPRAFLFLSPWLFSVFGARDVDVADAWRGAPRTPAFIVHGEVDTAIAPSNAERLRAITGGDLWMVPGAGHTDAYNVERREYIARSVAFLERVTSRDERRTDGCKSEL